MPRHPVPPPPSPTSSMHPIARIASHPTPNPEPARAACQRSTDTYSSDQDAALARVRRDSANAAAVRATDRRLSELEWKLHLVPILFVLVRLPGTMDEVVTLLLLSVFVTLSTTADAAANGRLRHRSTPTTMRTILLLQHREAARRSPAQSYCDVVVRAVQHLAHHFQYSLCGPSLSEPLTFSL